MPTPLSRDPRRAARERSTTSTESDPRAPSSTKGLEPTTPPDSTTASKTKVRQRPPRRPQTHFPPPRASAPAIPRLNQPWASARPGPPEIGVLAVDGHQLVVRAQLGDPTVDDDRDPVGVVRGVQPVRDGDDRAALEQRVY